MSLACDCFFPRSKSRPGRPRRIVVAYYQSHSSFLLSFTRGRCRGIVVARKPAIETYQTLLLPNHCLLSIAIVALTCGRCRGPSGGGGRRRRQDPRPTHPPGRSGCRRGSARCRGGRGAAAVAAVTEAAWHPRLASDACRGHGSMVSEMRRGAAAAARRMAFGGVVRCRRGGLGARGLLMTGVEQD